MTGEAWQGWCRYHGQMGTDVANENFPNGQSSYANRTTRGKLDETRPKVSAGDQNALFVRGRVAGGARINTAGAAVQTRTDRAAQEDSLRLAYKGAGSVAIEQATPIDLTRESNGQLSLIVDYRVTSRPAGQVTLGLADTARTATVPLTGAMTQGDWMTAAVPLRCFADQGIAMGKVTQPFVLSSTGALGVDVSGIRIGSAPAGPVTCGSK